MLNRKIARMMESYLASHQVELQSGNVIKYIPISSSLIQILHEVGPGQSELILYWDGFRKFRAKGGSLGFALFSFFFFPLFPFLRLISPP